MKAKFQIILSFLLVIVVFQGELKSQESISGNIIFEQIVDYGFEPRGNPRWDNFIADLPKSGTTSFKLSFANNKSLYEKTINEEGIDPNLARALRFKNFRSGPQPEVAKVFLDLEKNVKTEQFEFMTRFFEVDKEIESKAWKLTNNKKQVLDYICFGADLENNGEVLTAWFTSQIPVFSGPGDFYGLPGMILALEKNDEVYLIAKTIEINKEEIPTVEKPKEGKNMSEAEFMDMVKEKQEEHKKTMKNRRKGRGPR